MQTVRNIYLISTAIFISFISSWAIAESSADGAAISPDECVQDKACVWNALDKMVGSNFASDENGLWVIRKWEKPIKIKLMGNDADVYRERLETNAALIESYIDQPILFDASRFNSFVLLDKDLRKSFLEDNYSYFRSGLGTLVDGVEGRFSEGRDIYCYMQSYQGKGFVNIGALLMADTDHEDFEKCAMDILYELVAYKRFLHPEFGDSKDLSSLDVLLLKIIYSNEIKSGMNKQDVELIFNAVYDAAR